MLILSILPITAETHEIFNESATVEYMNAVCQNSSLEIWDICMDFYQLYSPLDSSFANGDFFNDSEKCSVEHSSGKDFFATPGTQPRTSALVLLNDPKTGVALFKYGDCAREKKPQRNFTTVATKTNQGALTLFDAKKFNVAFIDLFDLSAAYFLQLKGYISPNQKSKKKTYCSMAIGKTIDVVSVTLISLAILYVVQYEHIFNNKHGFLHENVYNSFNRSPATSYSSVKSPWFDWVKEYLTIVQPEDEVLPAEKHEKQETKNSRHNQRQHVLDQLRVMASSGGKTAKKILDKVEERSARKGKVKSETFEDSGNGDFFVDEDKKIVDALQVISGYLKANAYHQRYDIVHESFANILQFFKNQAYPEPIEKPKEETESFLEKVMNIVMEQTTVSDTETTPKNDRNSDDTNVKKSSIGRTSNSVRSEYVEGIKPIQKQKNDKNDFLAKFANFVRENLSDQEEKQETRHQNMQKSTQETYGRSKPNNNKHVKTEKKNVNQASTKRIQEYVGQFLASQENKNSLDEGDSAPIFVDQEYSPKAPSHLHDDLSRTAGDLVSGLAKFYNQYMTLQNTEESRSGEHSKHKHNARSEQRKETGAEFTANHGTDNVGELMKRFKDYLAVSSDSTSTMSEPTQDNFESIFVKQRGDNSKLETSAENLKNLAIQFSNYFKKKLTDEGADESLWHFNKNHYKSKFITGLTDMLAEQEEKKTLETDSSSAILIDQNSEKKAEHVDQIGDKIINTMEYFWDAIKQNLAKEKPQLEVQVKEGSDHERSEEIFDQENKIVERKANEGTDDAQETKGQLNGFWGNLFYEPKDYLEF